MTLFLSSFFLHFAGGISSESMPEKYFQSHCYLKISVFFTSYLTVWVKISRFHRSVYSCPWVKEEERKVNRPRYPTAFSISVPANLELGTSLGLPGSGGSHLWCSSLLHVFSGCGFPCYGLFIHVVSPAFCLLQKFVKLPALNMAYDWCMLLMMILAKFWKILWDLCSFNMNSDVLPAGFYFVQVITHCAAKLFLWCLSMPVFKYFEDMLLLPKWIITDLLFVTYVIILYITKEIILPLLSILVLVIPF